MRTIEIDHPIGVRESQLKVPADLALGDVIGVTSICGRTEYRVTRARFVALYNSPTIVGRTDAGTERWFHTEPVRSCATPIRHRDGSGTDL